MAHEASQPLIWRKGLAPGPDALPLSVRLQRQLRLAAQFGMFAARSDNTQSLLEKTCRVAAEGLGAAFAQVLVYRPDQRAFVPLAGVRWRDGIVGQAQWDADTVTPTGFAWQSGRSTASNDRVVDTGFRLLDVRGWPGMARCIDVVIPSPGEAAFGVLQVASPEPGEFAEHDLSFLQVLAQNLAAAIGRGAAQARHEEQTARNSEDHETSLRELQHRVRNHLQAICGIVDVEACRAADPLQRMGFERVNRHVMALAGLYDHLLGVRTDDSVIDLGAYLRSLCDKMADVTDLASRAIELSVDTEPLSMPLDRAVLVAVALNELVANAAEHAFPDNRPGRIAVRLMSKGDGTGCPVVTVTDDGCGLNGPQPGSAGLGFVKRLIHQAGGVLAQDEGNGTRWHIKLAPERPRTRTLVTGGPSEPAERARKNGVPA